MTIANNHYLAINSSKGDGIGTHWEGAQSEAAHLVWRAVLDPAFPHNREDVNGLEMCAPTSRRALDAGLQSSILCILDVLKEARNVLLHGTPLDAPHQERTYWSPNTLT